LKSWAEWIRITQRFHTRRAPLRILSAPETIFNLSFEVEHIIPISRNGLDIETNLALACRSGNLHKADHVAAYDELTNRPIRLFDPRVDLWDVHFRLARETGKLEGLTGIGRASIVRLQMNGAQQTTARLRWIRAGLFP